jgi:hypothetical protein
MPIPPITHYKDEVPDQTTQDLVNQEIEKEAAQQVVEEKTPELKVLPVEKPIKKKQTNASNIVNAFRQKMALNTISIDLPSAGKTLEFKEISAAEQKELSKIALENDSRADIMYCAMVNLINKLSVDKKFDIRDYTEFERLVVTMNLQQMNKINPEIKFTCSKCGKENSYRLDTLELLRKFNKTYKPDQEYEIEAGNKKYTFTIGWALVRNIEDFFKNFYRKYDNSGKNLKETMNNMSQIEYITMFIKGITVEDVGNSDDKLSANLEDLTYGERVQIMDCLPQSVVFDENTGVIGKVIENFVTPMNNCFKYKDCSFCGSEQSGTMANVTDFIGG